MTPSLKETSSNAIVALEFVAFEIASLFGLTLLEVKRRHSREAMGRASARLATRGAERHLEAVRRRLKRSPLTVGGTKVTRGT